MDGEEICDQSAGENLNGGGLLRSQRTEAALEAAQFALADFFGLFLQGDDGRGHVDGALTLMKALDLACNQGFGVAGFPAALGHVRGGHLLQVVDIVDEDAFQLVTAGSTSRGTAMSMKNMGRLRRRCRKAWACSRRKMGCGAPVEVMTISALAGRFMKLVEGNDAALELIGHALCAFESAVGDEDGACALL